MVGYVLYDGVSLVESFTLLRQKLFLDLNKDRFTFTHFLINWKIDISVHTYSHTDTF